MNRIFISYKRADKNRVFLIQDRIEAVTGEQCWIDLEGIESDAQFVNVIMRAIDEADIFLFMFSKAHAKIDNFENDWTVREINYAQKKKKRIVFVNLDQTPMNDWFEFMFGLKQQVDATNDQAIDHLARDICKWLNIKPQKPKQKPEPERKTIYVQQQMVNENADQQQTVQSPLSSKEPTTKEDSKIGWVVFITIVAVVGLVIVIIAATGGFDSDYDGYEWAGVDTAEVVEVVADEVPEAEVVEVAPIAPAWPWSPFAKQKLYNVEFRGGFTWNGMSIVLKDLEIDNMLNKKCYIVIWFRDAKGHYLKTDYSEHQGYGGYACYVTEAKPNYKYCNWKEFTLPTIDTSILDAPSGTKIYITLAVYAAANGKCVGKWKSDGYCHK